jgi:nucleotide-binding universal stress UspA family protein
MSILCGTDFSEPAARAATVAARLAARTHEPLHLLHALDLPKQEMTTAKPLVAWAEERLSHEVARLKELGADVRSHVTAGPADEALQESARELSARLIVIGALGQRRASAHELGSHADRTAQRSHVPVLVVRDAEPFQDWLAKARPLKILLGVDASLSSEHAGHWINELTSFGPCEVVLSHLYWPPAEFHRIGLGGVRSYVDPDSEILRTLKHEYAERFAGLFGSARIQYRIEPNLGRVGDALASLASDERADLVVIGCHEHRGLSLVWQGSVARRVLACSATSVACIPAPAKPAALRTPILDNVLAATDFSRHGDAAVAMAYAMVNHGGTVHLVHVIKASHAPTEPYDIFGPAPSAALADAEAAARSRLINAIPHDAGSLAAATRVHVVFAGRPALAICQAAERLGSDVICVGTHGRSGVTKALTGSVASGVLENTTRPVMLARPGQP